MHVFIIEKEFHQTLWKLNTYCGVAILIHTLVGLDYENKNFISRIYDAR